MGKKANGERNGEAPLILLHAEDQMAGTETMRVMATELIEIHKQLQRQIVGVIAAMGRAVQQTTQSS